MGFGAVFLLAFSGGLATLYAVRPEWTTREGMTERINRLKVGLWIMAITVWGTVITGTFIVYPWYRAKPPEGADLSGFPRYLLLNDPSTAGWHQFGMEWKEHIGWLAPIAATVVAYVVSYYGLRLANEGGLRKALFWFFLISFSAAAVAGIFGAFINKVAPIR
jgi:hypothetical protein